ncbi:MAG: AEC family transporter [Firmicutes bacterium]|nr:AEC family transporter [Bacillota bacterium]
MTAALAVDNSVIINQVTVLFLLMMIGFYTTKRGILTAAIIEGFSSFLLNVSLPFMVITAFHMEFSRDMLRDAGLVFLISTALHLSTLLGSRFLFRRYPPDRQKILRLVMIFSNCGFMGFPILDSIYGKAGVFFGSIYVVVFNIFFWTAGVALFTGVKDIRAIKTALKNPGILAVGVGLPIFIFSLPIPSPVYTTLDMVGSMTTPLAMIIVGSLLANLKLKEVFAEPSVYYATLLRLIILPILTMGIMRLLGFGGLVLQVMVTTMAMPAATTTVILAEMYGDDGGNPEYASRIVFISTILSMITIPAMILLVQALA